MLRKLIVSLVLASAAIGGGVMAWKFFVANAPPVARREVKPMIPRVEAPPLRARTNYQVEITGQGEVRAYKQTPLQPKVSGEIDYRSDAFVSGRVVKGPQGDQPGEVLFRIDSQRYQLAVQDAEAQIALLRQRLKSLDAEETNLQKLEKIASEQLALDENELERYQQLLTEGASTTSEIEQAMSRLLATRRSLQDIKNQLTLIPERRAELEAQIAAARVKLMQARLDLEYTTFRSPVTGRIISSDIDKGTYVQTGEVCGEMYATDVMELPISILASELRWIDRQAVDTEGLPAEVTWSEPGTGRTYTWQGRVERIESAEATTRLPRLVVMVDNTKQPTNDSDVDMMLDINMYCRVVVKGVTVDKAYLIPRSAVLAGSSVYLAKPDPETGYQLEQRDVRVARYTDGMAMILPGGGLNDGDRVVLSTVPKPVVGMDILVQESTPEARPEPPATQAAAGGAP